MTSNATLTTSDTPEERNSTLLWLPYVILTIVIIFGLAGNFYCYHRRFRSRCKRKAEVQETRLRVMERRMLLNEVKARYRNALERSIVGDDKNNATHSKEVYTNPHADGFSNLLAPPKQLDVIQTFIEVPVQTVYKYGPVDV